MDWRTTIVGVIFLLISISLASSVYSQSQPVLRTQYIQEVMNQPNFISIHGEIPEFESYYEESKWGETLCDIKKGIQDKMLEKYFSPYSHLTGYGIGKSYQAIWLKPGMGKNRVLRMEIYQLINKEAKEKGIWDIPVIFFEGDAAQKTKPIPFSPIIGEWFGIDIMNEISKGYMQSQNVG